MESIQSKSIDQPDVRREFDKGYVELLSLGDVTFSRATFQPGWRWSECVKPLVKTDSCQVHHTTYVVSGHLHIEHGDGAVLDAVPGTLCIIAPGHDAWVVGDEPVVAVDFDEAGRDYAKPVD
ncbi:MAG: cupin domain-containing protein [Acidimicrobiales bacterium]